MHAILRAIVNMVLNSEECVALQRYIVLKREIMTTAAGALDGMRDDARKMVAGMVEMERSYLTAEVFREILASSHAVDELSEEVHVRDLPCVAVSPADALRAEAEMGAQCCSSARARRCLTHSLPSLEACTERSLPMLPSAS